MKICLKVFLITALMFLFVEGLIYADFPPEKPITEGLNSPTAHTLNEGEFTVGLGPVNYGLTDEIQIGTNILLFFIGPNINAKIGLIDPIKEGFGVGLGAGYWKSDIGNLEDISALTISLPVTKGLNEKWQLHLTGQYASISEEVGDEVSAVFSGTTITAGVEGDMGEMSKFLAEGGYDVDFETTRFGAGLLFGWEQFRLKLGAVLHPKTWPIINLWWRFGG